MASVEVPLNTSKHTGKIKKVHKKRVSKEEQHKVIFVGDSHARKCATEVNQLLNNDFEVPGFVKCRFRNEIHKGHIRGKITAVIKERCVGVMGRGSKDTAKNNSIGSMRHLLELVINANHINVIVMSAPHRHDLMSNSCVNKEIEKFNRKLHL
jgi:hypothetical protein